MKIVSGGVMIPVLGVCEDFIHMEDEVRPAFRIRLQEPLAPGLLDSLASNPITLCNETGAEVGLYTGYDSLHEVMVTLVKPSKAELEARALRAEIEALRAERESLLTENAMLIMAAPVTTKEAI